MLAQWDAGEKLVFTRNPRYHGRFGGNLSELEFRFGTYQKALELYEFDELDGVALLEEDIEQYRNTHPGEFVILPLLVTRFLAFNLHSPPFSDSRVRQAFAMAIDRDEYAIKTLKGINKAASGGLIPYGMPGHSPDIGLPFDPDQARELLSAAGYPEAANFPRIKLLVPFKREGYFWIAEQLRRILGVEIEVSALQYPSFMKALDEDLPKIWGAQWWADYPDPANILIDGIRMGQLQHLNWTDAEFDRIIQSAEASLDPVKRIARFREADQILIREAVLCPLHYERWYLLFKSRVRVCPTSPLPKLFSTDIVMADE
jgi:ABC-type transport system substrate-binding protein